MRLTAPRPFCCYRKMSRLKVRVSPGARGDAIAGWIGDALKVRVAAPPERGKANDAVVALVAGALGIPASRVTVVRGATSRDKLLQVEDVSEDEVRRRLGD